MRLASGLVFVSLCVSLSSFAAPAGAASIIRDPSPPQYKVEIEPHLNVQWFGFDHRSNGFGPGIRFGIPVMSPGFIKSINDSVAISFGADLMYYSPTTKSCRGNECVEGPSYWVLYAPVVLQWNFWLTDKISVFGEPGLTFRTDFDKCDVAYCGSRGSPIYPSFFGGARFHLAERGALTVRVGFPHGISVGWSFF